MSIQNVARQKGGFRSTVCTCISLEDLVLGAHSIQHDGDHLFWPHLL